MYTSTTAASIPLESRFMVFSTSSSLNDPNAVAWFYPETFYNDYATVQKSRTDKSIVSQEDRRYQMRITSDWRKTNWCRMNLYIWNEGLLAPQNGDPNTYESFRMEAYQLFGTPNQIWTAIQTTTATENLPINTVKDSKINVFPNPTNGTINIKMNGIIVEKISLIDNLGKDLTSKIRHLSTTKEKIVLDLSNLSNGLYYLILNDNSIHKILKN
jgi:hypothetical protein